MTILKRDWFSKMLRSLGHALIVIFALIATSVASFAQQQSGAARPAKPPNSWTTSTQATPEVDQAQAKPSTASTAAKTQTLPQTPLEFVKPPATANAPAETPDRAPQLAQPEASPSYRPAAELPTFAPIESGEPATPFMQPIEPTTSEPQAASPSPEPSDKDASVKNSAAGIVEAHTPKMTYWKGLLKSIDQILEDPATSDEKLRELPGQLDKTRTELTEFSNELRPKFEDVKARLAKLGPPPKEGEPTETDAIKAQRQQLNDELAAYDGLIKQAGVLSVKAAQQTDLSNKLRRERFSKRLTQPVALYHSPFFWSKAIEGVPEQTSAFLKEIRSTFSRTFENGKSGLGLIVLIVPFALFAAWWIPMRTLSAFTLSAVPFGKPSGPARAYNVLFRTLFSLVPWLAAVLGLYISANVLGFITPATNHFAMLSVAVLASAGLFITVFRKSLDNKNSEWRVFARDSRATGWLIAIATALTILWATDQILAQSDAVNNTPYPFTVLRGVAFSVAYALLLLSLLFVPLRQKRENEAVRLRGWPRPVYYFIALMITTIALATFLGYVSLARFIGSQIVTTGSILYIMYLMHAAGEYISSGAAQSSSSDGDDPDHFGVLRVVAGLVLDILILLVGIPALLLQFGFDWTEVEGWIRAAFFGFSIGNVTISVQAILIALGILVLGVLLTRVIQRSFVRRAALTGRLDNGIRDSVRTGLGYLGFIASVMAAASFLGLNASSLAIVAGGLSLGLGFGMQSIFNNFISGLILLVERPIKIGDWIAAGPSEGRVRKINVRATEIETIDRQTVIVPNAELITGSVKNWTYSDRTARVVISIGVSYNSDAEKVRELLLGIANAHPEILAVPAPTVIFMAFGESSLDFEVRTYIGDADRRIHVASDLRFQILSTLRQNNIEIPFPQRDLNIRTIDGREASPGDTPVQDHLAIQQTRTA